ncbi:uncharacterized protein CC84DRAFT_567985 [Paraphaeosphaeria sporulosa]|uniref:Uncharacterized protein n=1 Tax=Paraphaeosphaeria sporulosa TaxID=1460663 RepID=A0A177CN22_9PLEO|nr:uncharacterized protein CC84DRAFT_567985 [Paraphaeosphaeria sporulosa]OAG08290.1 hypothetical protein CC84DRAFT_567985 [Paraphaeosphaeria sporulosa]
MIGVPGSGTQERRFWKRTNRLNWRLYGGVEEWFLTVPEHFPLNPEGQTREEAVRRLVHLPSACVIPPSLFFYHQYTQQHPHGVSFRDLRALSTASDWLQCESFVTLLQRSRSWAEASGALPTFFRLSRKPRLTHRISRCYVRITGLVLTISELFTATAV